MKTASVGHEVNKKKKKWREKKKTEGKKCGK